MEDSRREVRKGLQLINIIRDVGRGLETGPLLFAKDELKR